MGFFGDLLKGVGSVLGVTSKVASPWSAAIGSLGNLIGNQESSAEAERVRREQNDLNTQYLEHLKRTNEQNYRMFQEQNQYNAQAATTAFQHQMTLQRDQQAYNTQMWNANNTYNSPEQQRERWEAAGFSPWTLATGGTGAGGLSSAPSSSQGSAPQARAGTPVAAQVMQQLASPKMLGLQAMRELVESSLSVQRTFNDTLRTNVIPSEIDKNNSQASYNRALAGLTLFTEEHARNMSPLQRELLGLEVDQARTDLDYSNATYMERKRQLSLDNDIRSTQLSSLLLSNRAKDIENKYLDAMSQARIGLMAAETYQAVENGNLSISRAKEAIAHAFLMSAQKEGVDADNAPKKELAKKAKEYADELFLALSLSNDELFYRGELKGTETLYRSIYGFSDSLLGIADKIHWNTTDKGLSWTDRKNYRRKLLNLP